MSPLAPWSGRAPRALPLVSGNFNGVAIPSVRLAVCVPVVSGNFNGVAIPSVRLAVCVPEPYFSLCSEIARKLRFVRVE